MVENATYYCVVRSIDLSFNRSGNSSQVSATAAPRNVTLVFNDTQTLNDTVLNWRNVAP